MYMARWFMLGLITNCNVTFMVFYAYIKMANTHYVHMDPLSLHERMDIYTGVEFCSDKCNS